MMRNRRTVIEVFSLIMVFVLLCVFPSSQEQYYSLHQNYWPACACVDGFAIGTLAVAVARPRGITPNNVPSSRSTVTATTNLSSTIRAASRIDYEEPGPEPTAAPLAVARLVGYVPPDQENDLIHILLNAGYKKVLLGNEDDGVGVGLRSPVGATAEFVFPYKYVKASAMLKLMECGITSTAGDIHSNGGDCGNSNSNHISMIGEAPRYIPVQNGEENVLAANGWSFLDPDESEPLSSYDIDAANQEGQYTPKWGSIDADMSMNPLSTMLHSSSLGYDLKRPSSEDILSAVQTEDINTQAEEVLLHGGTDAPHEKLTNNGYDFSSSSSSSQLKIEGVFTCAIGALPLFTTAESLSGPGSSSTGWLSFTNPVAEDHIQLIHPHVQSLDQRIEVVDARTGCHLGHYFGPNEGYCINASALNFIPLHDVVESEDGVTNNGALTRHNVSPISWKAWCENVNKDLPNDSINNRNSSRGHQMLHQVAMQQIHPEEILLGAGCFWHTEYAIRRLPGIIDTKVGYAGGNAPHPTYKDVCSDDTGHAEVVRVIFDPNVCGARKLIDCWLAMHDPTNVRAHGKRAQGTGQYRSCAFVYDKNMEGVVVDALADCRKQLGKMLSSEVRISDGVTTSAHFWLAEDRHQRHDERRQENRRINNDKNNAGESSSALSMLSFEQWLLEYGRRSASIWGSSETSNAAPLDDSGDDGM
eukprot:CAMPEP_0194104150 /NCGR_PEP_ID=MMETSP0150-20130528/4507_1 /TAXON_ID=122233 /ORGANISM="Chaetoceros debilis, Strain MM31A-1" /LENGTH=699 /DNA_ID=CAMNT_0038791579 /DNA_START=97 /DNA_END=2193 /DNA_ORIENTATION=-